MSEKITGASIAREYRDKYGMEMPTLKLARIMYKDHNLRFRDVEHARRTLRAIEGKDGKDRRGVIMKTHKMEEARPYNPYGMPESFHEKKDPYILPVGCNKTLYLPDLHLPYHDIRAISTAIDTGLKVGVNTIIMPGDVMDMHKGSKYQPNPKKRSIKDEFDACGEFLTSLREVFPTQTIIWQKGNHCIRWEAFLLMKSQELYDDPYWHLEDRLQLINRKIKIISDKQVIQAGNLNITHGHLIFNGGFGGPVNPAKTLWDKTGMQYACGHIHSVSTYKKVRKHGEDQYCFTMGCLSERDPDYNPIVNRYEHGFAIQYTESDGRFEFNNYRVENGKARL